MKFYKITSDKKIIQYTFQSNIDKNNYIKICTKIWGCVPCDVNWAKNSNLYKQFII